jgi:hypothetical protein
MPPRAHQHLVQNEEVVFKLSDNEAQVELPHDAHAEETLLLQLPRGGQRYTVRKNVTRKSQQMAPCNFQGCSGIHNTCLTLHQGTGLEHSLQAYLKHSLQLLLRP